MGDETREELLRSVGEVVEAKLKLHNQANGYVSNPKFEATVKVLTSTMGQVADAVTDVKNEVIHQRRATEDLGKATSQLCIDLAEHKAEHRGAEKAKDSVRLRSAAVVAEKSSNWKRNSVIVAMVIGALGLLGGFSAWFVSRTEAALSERLPMKIVIDKAAAKEIAKAIEEDQ